MGYFVRERIFVGCGPNLIAPATVFAADDLTDEECRTLEGSVQRFLDEARESGGNGPWSFELGPSAQEDASVFINRKFEWKKIKRELDEYRSTSGDSWQSDIVWLHDIAKEHADIIRSMRADQMPTVYLQCDAGRGFETFDCVDSLTWPEIETLVPLT